MSHYLASRTPIVQCESGGCLAKVSGLNLISLISKARQIAGCEVEASAEEPEDATIVDINGQTFLLTTDMGPLVGIDAVDAGKIAALHALSDIYVMGGIPTHVLITLVIQKKATQEQAAGILAGVFSACNEENVKVIGGHTILGEEFLIGITAIGITSHKGIKRKQGCATGDVLMVSKPIGSGMIARALFLGELTEEDYFDALDVMLKSNKKSAHAAFEIEKVHALTDITGFGFLGHLSEMLDDKQGAMLDFGSIPQLPGLSKLFEDSVHTIYTSGNMEYAKRKHKIIVNVDNMKKLILLDPQTNGPVLAAVAPSNVNQMKRNGFIAVGYVTDNGSIHIN